MENYTLNRFYHEAKAILEKYHIQGKEDYEFSVDFGISENKLLKQPTLVCRVHYWSEKYNSEQPHYSGYGYSPILALNSFEVNIRKQNGFILCDNVSVEIENEKPKLS
jgi:hypothetical protein